MLTPDDMNLRAKALILKSAAGGVSSGPYRELALEWRLLAVQSIFLDAMLAPEAVRQGD
ncbi:hypothetical protein [Phenylobacterium sp.]|uniref:hypothetical protein n=1 Tax=Phenylobacterium sp. TaxID=1871053 RepID=UPI00271822E9|nr:hypothetical protein [Phenylobacterium sp.]MDO8378333.1 hypothetical protein [Phenylobacterium sp.]